MIVVKAQNSLIIDVGREGLRGADSHAESRQARHGFRRHEVAWATGLDLNAYRCLNLNFKLSNSVIII